TLRPAGREVADLRCVLMGGVSDDGWSACECRAPGWRFTTLAMPGVRRSGRGRVGGDPRHGDPGSAAITAAPDRTGGSVRSEGHGRTGHRSAQPGLVAGDDQTLDLAGAFVDLGDLGIAEVALDRHFLAVAHA